MFKKGEAVIYPTYGVGKIAKIYKEFINDADAEYYQVLFENSQVEVSVPVDNADELGLRMPMSKADLQKELDNLDKRKKVNKDVVATLKDEATLRLKTGLVSDIIELINLLNSVSKYHAKQGRSLSFSQNKNLQSAVKFLHSEVDLVLGAKAVKKYKLDIDA